MTEIAPPTKPTDNQSGNGKIKLGQDRFFNPWRGPRTSKAKALVLDVIQQVEAFEHHDKLRTRKRRPDDQAIFEKMIAAIISDVIHASLSGHHEGIAITRSHRELAKASRYQSKVFAKTLPRVLDHLSSPEMGFIEQIVGFKHRFADRHQRTLIGLGPRLKKRIDDSSLELNDLGWSSSEETIILKADKEGFWDGGKRIEYEDTHETTALRSRLAQINEWIGQATIHHLDERSGIYGDLDFGERRLQRIFTQGSFESGGRLFGGLWQHINKEKRLETVWIGEEEVIELDFGQLAPRMLYGLAGVEPPTTDAYLVPGLVDPTQFRAGFKKLFGALLFTEKPLGRKPKETEKLLPREPVQALVQRLYDLHPEIAHFFGTEIGHQLQFRESQMMVEILLRLRDRDIAALPVHDAVIIPASAEEVTRRVMSEVFLQGVGVGAIISRNPSLPSV